MGASYIPFTEHMHTEMRQHNGLTVNVMLPDYIQGPAALLGVLVMRYTVYGVGFVSTVVPLSVTGLISTFTCPRLILTRLALSAL